MKIPKKLWPLGLAFGVVALLASASALAAPLNSGGGVVLPKGVGQLSPYMIAAGGLDNVAYMDCVKASMKQPAEKNIVLDVQNAINCQNLKN